MSPNLFKTIIVSLKVTIISALLVKGLKQHCKKPERNRKVIALLLVYLLMLVLIATAELFYEYIPLIFAILTAASALQVYQLSIFVDDCGEYVAEKTVKAKKAVLVIFAVLYTVLLLMVFSQKGGPRCGKVPVMVSITPKTYPPCFVILLFLNIFLWVFSTT